MYLMFIVAAFLLTGVSWVSYNLLFHPLARFPGPLLHRATRLTFVYKFIRGTLPRDLLAMHERYGPVVRLAPNELAFASAEAWRDIYGHRPAGQEEFPKYPIFYRTRGVARSIITEDRDRHAVLRRQLAHGFSERSMRDQEPIIGGYVDLLILRLREHCVEGSDEQTEKSGIQATVATARRKPKALDMATWYNWTTFDIIGDLAFGEPFGCLEKVKYDSWVASITGFASSFSVLVGLRYLGLEALVQPLIRSFMKSRRRHLDNTREKLLRRMKADMERPDLIQGLLKKQDDWNIGIEHLQINASVLIAAGSETTATLLSGVTYLLLKHPKILKKLTAEVRGAFQSEEEITLLSVSKLSYMLACLDEAMRFYPPVPQGMPRMTPRGGGTIAGHFVPENTVVAVWQFATYHDSKLWTEPSSYCPERFLGDPKFANDKFDALQPFSVGPRNCIGRNLAYSEMRLILARIIFSFDMQLVDDKDDWMDQNIYIVWKKKPLNVYLTPVQ